MQTLLLPEAHVPFWQLSASVQALPSLQVVPFSLGGLEQTPVLGLHVPASWHWSCAVHVTGLLPVHTPAWQLSVWVQALPSLHAVPLVFGEQMPTRPARLQEEHWSVQAVLQQTPPVQLPEAHWLPEVQVLPPVTS